jgi:hydrogenase maturation protease
VNTELVENIANAVLYEGYMLYPYRASAVKNRQRWNFGVLYPRAFSESQEGSDASSMQTECLAQTSGESGRLTVTLRFLHVLERSTEDQIGPPWQEGTERHVCIASLNLADLSSHSVLHSFAFPGSFETDGNTVRKWEPIKGAIEVEAGDLGKGLCKIRIGVFNTVPIAEAARCNRDCALVRSLVSAHTILNIDGGEFISLLDPPDELRDAAGQCKNVGTWPVLVGESRERDAMLSSPIILYDYPQIAPESAGALFDGTEIDEILTLRIMTMTDQEKAEMGQTEERSREILQRTQSMPPEQLIKMHGALRGLREPRQENP